MVRPFLLFLLFTASVASAANTATVRSGDTLYSIARSHNLTIAKLKALNGLTSSTLKLGQVLKLAPASASIVKPTSVKPTSVKPTSVKPTSPIAKPITSTAKTYTIKAGDNLSDIAERFKIPLSKLKSSNGLQTNTVHIGQVLKLVPAGVVTATRPAISKAKVYTAKVYTVKAGDSLSTIADRYGIPLSKFKALNGLQSNTVRVGQVLKLVSAGTGTPARPASSATRIYIVKAGDSLGNIANRYGLSIAALSSTNNLNGTIIHVGQRLKIPAAGATISKPRTAWVDPNMVVRVIYQYARVRLGDTPERFASRYNANVDDIRRINNLSSRRQISLGKKLLVPSHIPVPRPPTPRRSAVSYRTINTMNVRAGVITVDLRYPNVLIQPILPNSNDVFGRGARVGQLARRTQATGVINGGYFHPQTYAPAGDVVMQGKMLAWGRIPMALAITPDNRATIRASNTPLLLRPLDSTWDGMETVIATGPRILSNGVVLSSYNRVFRDPALFGRAARSAVGLSSNRDLVFVSTHAKLTTTEMARLMARIGVRDALLLDGGSSAGMAWNGRPVMDSVRKVSYGIGIFAHYTGRRYTR